VLIAQGAARKEWGWKGDWLAGLTEARDLAAALSSKELEGLALFHIGDKHKLRGRFEPAREFLKQALSLLEEVESSFGIGMTHNSLGYICSLTGDNETAVLHYGLCISASEAAGNVRYMGMALSNRAEHRWDEGKLDLAARDFERAALVAERMNDTSRLRHLVLLAEVRIQLGQVELARTTIEPAIAGWRQGAYPSSSMEIPHLVCAWLNLADGDWAAAEAILKEGAQWCTDPVGLVKLELWRGAVLLLRGNTADARDAFLVAVEYGKKFKTMWAPTAPAAAYLAVAEAQLGHPERSWPAFAYARELIRRGRVNRYAAVVERLEDMLNPSGPAPPSQRKPFLDEMLAELVVRSIGERAREADPELGTSATLTDVAARRDQGRASAAQVATALDLARSRETAPRASAGGFEPGDLVSGRYRVARLIGRGGMGAGYLSQDEVLGEPVALKIIAPSGNSCPASLSERLRREVSSARKISSPHVIRIHDLGETEGGLLFLSMEYVPGQTLAALCESVGPLPWEQCYSLLTQICDGLAAAHAASVVHRDLKPQNVLVGPEAKIKIIDFGLAKTTFHEQKSTTSAVLGTPAYMSPEQISGGIVDARSDIYALGALAYHMVTGRPPFRRQSPIAVAFAHLNDEPTRPQELVKHVPDAVADAILAALAKKPEDRPPTVAAFRGYFS
jgi:serine/threonine-protein kinase